MNQNGLRRSKRNFFDSSMRPFELAKMANHIQCIHQSKIINTKDHLWFEMISLCHILPLSQIFLTIQRRLSMITVPW